MNAITPIFGCSAAGMPFEIALERILDLVRGPLAPEDVPLPKCVGRVIAMPFAARRDLPGFDQSAMDGYAVRCAGLAPDGRLPVIGRTAAGEAPSRLDPGCAHRVLTGAPIPDGADAVVAQECVDIRDGILQVSGVPSVGTNVRRRGEDIRAGQRLIAEGASLDWRHVAILAAQGAQFVAVRRRPRVTLLSTGRELRQVGESLVSGQIYDSNLPMLAAFLQAEGAIVRPVAAVMDETEATRGALLDATADADLVLTTAGISVGEEDHVRDALRDLGGNLDVLKVAMKPGKPLAAGRLAHAVFVGLPGNPMAALAGAVAFVRPLLARLMGAPDPAPICANSGFTMCRKPGRAEFIPVRLHRRGTCSWAERAGPDGSGRLAPMLAATGFAFLSAGIDAIRHGGEIDVIPFNRDMTASEGSHG